ncbi:MAG: energy transducer TonB [Lentimicrobiaceae bacterium]|nr:energy transducer TonB [Lentimicrobiaceae bacterium]
MEPKKSLKSDLERRKPTFFLIGLVVSLSVVYLAFEFVRTKEKNENIVKGTKFFEEELVILYPVDLPQPAAQQANATETKISTRYVEDLIIDVELYENLTVDDVVNIEEDVLTTEALSLFADTYSESSDGMDEMYEKVMKIFQENLRYPESARKEGVEGKVIVELIVGKNGRLVNFTVLENAAPILDNEVLRVVKLMPKWKPRKNHGEIAHVKYQVPVNFMLDN